MIYILPLMILLIISLFFKLYFKFKIEEALFCSMSTIIVILTIFGLFGIMNIGQYLLYLLSFISFIYVVYCLLKAKQQISFEEIFTPGLIIVLLSFIFYTIMTKNNVLYIWDEASRYGTAAHYMDVTDKISHGGCITVFSYFFTKCIGYSEHSLFVSRWLFMWICVALPLSRLKWNKWYMAALYAVFAFSIMTLIDPETKYLMDAPIGIIAGSGIAYLAIMRNKFRASIFTLICVLTITLKDNVSLVLFAFMMLFAFSYFSVESLKPDWELTKKNIINTAIFIFSITITLFIKESIMPVGLKEITAMLRDKLLILIIVTTIMIAAIILWFTWAHKIFKRYLIKRFQQNPKTHKLIKVATLAIIPFLILSFAYKFIWQILYSLNMQKQEVVKFQTLLEYPAPMKYRKMRTLLLIRISILFKMLLMLLCKSLQSI